MKSFLRYLVTENTKLEVPLLPAGAVTDARNQTMQVYNSLKPLSEPLVGFPEDQLFCQHMAGWINLNHMMSDSSAEIVNLLCRHLCCNCQYTQLSQGWHQMLVSVVRAAASSRSSEDISLPPLHVPTNVAQTRHIHSSPFERRKPGRFRASSSCRMIPCHHCPMQTSPQVCKCISALCHLPKLPARDF